MKARIGKWGNSAAVRLSRKELDRLGLREGDEVDVVVQPAKAPKWDVSMLPIFSTGKPTSLAQARRQWAEARVKDLHARR